MEMLLELISTALSSYCVRCQSTLSGVFVTGLSWGQCNVSRSDVCICRLGSWETDSETEISTLEVYLSVPLMLRPIEGKGQQQGWKRQK